MKALTKISQRFSAMSVSLRLAGSFGLLLMLALLLGAAGIGGMYRLESRITEIVTFNNAKLGIAHSMVRAIGEQEKGLLRLVLATHNEQKESILKTIKYQGEQYADAKNGLAEVLTLSQPTALETDIAAKIKAHEEQVPQMMAKALQHAEDDAEAALKDLQDEIMPAMAKWVVDLDELVSIEQRLNDAAVAVAQKETALLRALTLAAAVLALVVGTSMAFLITRSLRRALGGEPQHAATIARQLAAGDLSMTIPVKAGDDSSLMVALNDTVSQLSRIIGEINMASNTISTAVGEIASGNNDLSQRTEQQAASLQETAASMEQLTATVKQTAGNARQANSLAAGATDVAVKGGHVVEKVVSTMSSIEESSKRIADITSVINGIAFQTNILALNAAVEAARAGEQGRGFAVVASEVRSLAQRSAKAAKEIEGLIGSSAERVAEGSRLVGEAGRTMNEIVTAVSNVTQIINQISVASAEQSEGIAQVNTAIAQMDQTTQRNAALVEQAAAASDSMQEQARGLLRSVAVFRLNQA